MKTMAKFLMGSVTALTLLTLPTTSWAADAEPVLLQPPFASTVSLGYEYTYANSPDDDETMNLNGAFLEGALLFNTGGNLNFQVDGDFRWSDFTSSSPSSSNDEDYMERFYVGGAIFWRDPGMGLFGIDGAYGELNTALSDAGFSNYQIGARAEWYPNEMVTLGGRAGYIAGEEPNYPSDGDNGHGYYLNASLRGYFSDNWASKASFDYMNFPDWDDKSFSAFAATGEVEYLFDRGFISDNTSAFARVTYSGQVDDSTIYYTQAMVGLNFYFGSTGSLVTHHRTNTVDNKPWFNQVFHREGL